MSSTSGPSMVNLQGNVSTQDSVSAYKDLLQRFLTLSPFKLTSYQADTDFDQEVIRGCMSVQDPLKRQELAQLGAAAAKCFYPTHARKVQIVIATFTALMFSIDDLGRKFPDALRAVRTKIMLREPQGNKQIEDFLNMAFQMEEWLDTFAVDMVFKGQLEFLSANLVENENGDQLCPHKSTPYFLRNYFRLKSGISEPYAFFIWPADVIAQAGNHCCTPLAVMPDLMTWIDDTNDVMSFYKESIIGNERNNCVSIDARAIGKTPLESVKDYVESAMESLIRILEFAKVQQPEVRKKLQEFINGYITFHYNYPRYRLKELNLNLPGGN
ncbi:hypothetical protein ACLX1H_009103 [Fusarium chlamydosporum]